jgi:protein-glucosylgalactosylhydroxylysine glucosidase
MRLKFLLTILLAGALQAVSAQGDGWQLKAASIDPSNYYGVTNANGMIGLVSSPEPLKVKEVVLAGLYDLYGRGRVGNFIKGFNLLNTRIIVGDKMVEPGNISNFTQSLDMRKAAFNGAFTLNGQADIAYTYYALRQLPYCVLMQVNVTALQNTTLNASSILEAPDALRDVQNYYQEIDRPHITIPLMTSTAKTPTGKTTICATTSFMFKEAHGSEPRVYHEIWDNNMHLVKFNKALKAGETYTFWIVGATLSSFHHPDPLNEADRLAIFAKLEGPDRLIQKHEAAWNDLWKSDIQITGDDETQLEVRSMLYHLYSFVREGTSYSPSPMGLSGLGYNGHVFWDTELWMYPPLLMLHPELAKSTMEYRFERLEAAKKNAFAHGFKGAMFPWESAETGVEETPVWALSGPFEHHITACIGIAAWNYFCVTQDTTWLRERGWPLLKETADFWASRVERKGPKNYEINNVVAADEWAENVNNNAFTNGAAIVNLLNAGKAAKVLRIPADADWANVAANIPIKKMADGVTSEHDTYKGETIKQADVNLLAFPLKLITDPKQIEKDLAYYETRIDKGGPAMTQAIFAVLYSRINKGDRAFDMFKKGYQPNLRPPFGVIAECSVCNNPYFATGAGGMLQSILMGFGGLDITDQGIKNVSSAMPSKWKQLIITGVGKEKKTIKR